MALAVTVTGVGFVNSTSTSESSSTVRVKTKIRVPTSTAVERVLPCPGARKAVHYFRAAYGAHRRTQWLPGPVPYVRYDCEATVRRAAEWRDRAKAEREKAAEWVDYHYNWREWLPANWQDLGACETGYGRRPGNFNHSNSRFTSAFGISWAEYNADAAHMGAPPWHVRHTPRDQYLAALGHYDRFGDGWTCPGP